MLVGARVRDWHAIVALAVGAVASLLVLGLAGSARAAFSWSAPVEIAPHDGQGPAPLFAHVACPAVTQCTALNDDGDEATFDPASPGAPTLVPMTARLALGGGGELSCPSTAQCTVIDSNGQEITFNPSAPGQPMPVTVDTRGSLIWLVCPTTVTCTAVDDDNRAITFDPQHPKASAITLVPGEHDVGGLACGSASQCTATTSEGAVTFDPATATVLARISVGTTLKAGNRPLACPSSEQCTVGENVLQNGNEEVGGVTTIDPLTGRVIADVTIVAPRIIASIACATERQCTAVSDSEQITLDPAAPGSRTTSSLGAAIAAEDSGAITELAAVACPAATQCTAVGAQPVTFNPTIDAGHAAPTGAIVDEVHANGDPTAVACPSETQCTAIEQLGGEVTFDPVDPASRTTAVIDPVLESGHGWMSDIACPTGDQCTAVGFLYEQATSTWHGQEVTFDPSHPQSSAVFTMPLPLQAVSCPAVTQCTALTGNLGPGGSLGSATGEPLTFDPLAPAGGDLTSIGAESAEGISCPSVAQCTAVGLVKQGVGASTCCGGRALGGEVTLDPVNGVIGVSAVVDRDWTVPGQVCRFECNASRLVRVVCVSDTQCTAADYAGRALTFNPFRAGTPILMAIGLGAFACPATTECVSMRGAEASPTAVEASVGNPLSGAPWARQLIQGSRDVADVSCSSPRQCVGVGEDGLAIVGANAENPPASTPAKATITAKHVGGKKATVTVDCFARTTATCTLSLELVAARTYRRPRFYALHGAVRVGRTRVVLVGDQQATVRLTLNATGGALLATHHKLATSLISTEARVRRRWGELQFVVPGSRHST